MKFDIILDMANNHQGDVNHAKAIIDDMVEACSFEAFNYYLKFQYRELDTFVHKNADPKSNKHIKRFFETKLTWSEYETLANYAKKKGLNTISTPFDEASTRYLIEFGIDKAKIASCSGDDWPLIEAVAELNLPVVASTGGLKSNEVDALVSYFGHRAIDMSLMHCVGIYPSPRDTLNLQRISEFKRRYTGTPIGWSTHEDPDDLLPGAMALTLGATLFERHVGKQTDNVKLNAYSSTKDQIKSWLSQLASAKEILGTGRSEPLAAEMDSLLTLKRGVF